MKMKHSLYFDMYEEIHRFDYAVQRQCVSSLVIALASLQLPGIGLKSRMQTVFLPPHFFILFPLLDSPIDVSSSLLRSLQTSQYL
jgi:hypothetical protein